MAEAIRVTFPEMNHIDTGTVEASVKLLLCVRLAPLVHHVQTRVSALHIERATVSDGAGGGGGVVVRTSGVFTVMIMHPVMRAVGRAGHLRVRRQSELGQPHPVIARRAPRVLHQPRLVILARTL